MDTVRQALLVIHYRHHSWVWRYSARQATIKDSRNLHCLLGLVLSGIVIAVAVEAATLALHTTGR